MRRVYRQQFIAGACACIRQDPTLTPLAALHTWAQGQGLRRAIWTTTDEATQHALAVAVQRALRARQIPPR